MIRLALSPISVNRIWRGKRWMSKAGAQFKKDCALLLAAKGDQIRAMRGDMSIHFHFGLVRDMDTSNCIKLVEDCIAEHLGVNDSRFRGLTATKSKVRKGHEFIDIAITEYDEAQFLSPLGGF